MYNKLYTLEEMKELISELEKSKIQPTEKFVRLPYEIGTFVKVSDLEFKRSKLPDEELIGTISGYTVFSDGILCWVSGYKESWCGEFMLNEISELTEKEISELKKSKG